MPTIHMSNFLPDIIASHKLKNIPTEEVTSKSFQQHPPATTNSIYSNKIFACGRDKICSSTKGTFCSFRLIYMPAHVVEGINFRQKTRTKTSHPSFPWIAHFFKKFSAQK